METLFFTKKVLVHYASQQIIRATG